MPAEPKVVTNGPPRELTEVRADSGFAWSCQTGHAEDGELTEIHQITSDDRDEYERHMRGHGFKPPKSAYQRWTPWTPPRPAKESRPKPMDPGQRVEWVRVAEGHWEGRTYVEATDTTVARFEGGTWVDEVRETRAGVIWSVADTVSAWWVQPDDDPLYPVYVKRAGKRERYEHGEGALYEVPGVGEASRASTIRAEVIRRRGIFPVIDSQSSGYGSTSWGTNHIYLKWHSDPQCPQAAGKDHYDPDSRPQGIVYGYQPEGRAIRSLGQSRWTVLDVADTLISGEQPPSCLCPDCIVNLDPHPPATPTAASMPGPASTPAAATGPDAGTGDPAPPQQIIAATRTGQAEPGSHEETTMRTTRRPDRKPETPADTRFFDLRERGYTGPIDQDGYAVMSHTGPDGRPLSMFEGGTGQGTPDDPDHPGASARAGRAPGANPVTTRLAVSLELPATDGEFLQSCRQLGGTLRSLAGQVSDWAHGLSVLNLPALVLDPLLQASDQLTDAADGADKATAAFEDEFDDAREVAARGMIITGRDAA
jgi:hypothetical protein